MGQKDFGIKQKQVCIPKLNQKWHPGYLIKTTVCITGMGPGMGPKIESHYLRYAFKKAPKMTPKADVKKPGMHIQNGTGNGTNYLIKNSVCTTE